MAIHVETERLLLREFTGDDVQNLLDLDADPEVFKWAPEERPTREEIEHDVLPHYQRFYAQMPGFGFWAVEEKPNGGFIGWFHLRPGDGHKADEPELGYRFLHRAWGKGYATEGSRALIDKAFTEHPTKCVLAETAGFHTASRRVMEKCGMRLVREFDAGFPKIAPEDVLGDVEYAIERTEWEQQRAARG